jgi:hypothetical protein
MMGRLLHKHPTSFGCLLPTLLAPPHSSPLSKLAISSWSGEEKVSILFLFLAITPKTHLIILKVRGLLFPGRSLLPELRGSPHSFSHGSISIVPGPKDKGKVSFHLFCFLPHHKTGTHLVIATHCIRLGDRRPPKDSISLDPFPIPFESFNSGSSGKFYCDCWWINGLSIPLTPASIDIDAVCLLRRGKCSLKYIIYLIILIYYLTILFVFYNATI